MYILLHLESGQWVFMTEGDKAVIQAIFDKTADIDPDNWRIFEIVQELAPQAKAAAPLFVL